MPRAASLFTLAILPWLPAGAQQKPQIQLVGDAVPWENRIRLTPAILQAAGAAWFLEKQPVAAGFEMVFEFQLTQQGGLGNGADGLAFVIQNQGPEALAGRGSAGGFAIGDGRGDLNEPGIPRSIAVFFDTYQNRDGNDPSDNYIALCTNGPIGKMRWPPNRLGVGKKLKIRLKDGQPHRARIRYQPPLLTVYLDGGEPELRAPVDLATVTDPHGRAYIGFTASTGQGYENHDILGWKLTPDQPAVTSNISSVTSNITFGLTSCLPGRNLCTPPQPVVEELAPGRYHVVLPAHLEWSASLPNPNAKPIEITNARGNVCWDIDTPAGACAGPDGSAGALISKNERGRTWFSVNGRNVRRFSANQGFFEFDVTVP